MRPSPAFRWLLFVLVLPACQAGLESGLPRSMKPGLTVAADETVSAGQPPGAPPVTGGLAPGHWRKEGTIVDDVTAQGGGAAAPRMLVHRGEVRVEVARADEAMAEFRERVAAWGGYLQSQHDRTLIVRVPATRFEEAFAWVRAAGRILAESRQAEDVTEEFVDLGIRLDNARKARERLIEVLQKADKVEDILKVEAELRRLTEEIERMEGRKKLLADQVAMATLAATFQAVTEPPARVRAREPSRFRWLNRIGAERVMEDF
jgi:hypothetical protein